MDSIIDWQISRNEIKARGQYLLETGKWSDCNFLLGNEPTQQISLAGHKLILAMASPVFEAMFYGGLADPANDPIQILDVQTDAFKALLEYIYTDKISINSVDKAFDLCYAAKKYMLPHVVEQCTKFLWSDLCFKNACRAYEFSKLFEEPRLTEKCLQIMCTKTLDVLNDSSFEDVELSTILTILDQDALNVDSELNLFFALNRYVEKHGLNNQTQNAIDDQPNTSSSPLPPQISVEPGSSNQVEPAQQVAPQPAPQQHRRILVPTIKDAVRKIRFLTLTPQQFAEGPARTNLLTQSEAFSILMNISTPSSVYPMPENFTVNKNHRNNISVEDSRSPSPTLQLLPQPGHSQMHLPIAQIIPLEAESPNDNKLYCIRSVRNQTECLNTSVLDCSLTFSVDRSGICILGLQVPTQIYHAGNVIGSVVDRYHEIVYSHLLDYNGSRLTYTHSNQRVMYETTMEVLFNRPVYIQRHKIYKVGVVFNQVGWYQMSNCAPMVNCENGVTFTFGSPGQNESVRDGLIRGIIYTNSRD